uniref:Uncharacterized protein n=1 Tax=Picea sitchensis TaxID=3332 RepID=A9NXD1_PICSI|nr:unknown [Picea sitchensis]
MINTWVSHRGQLCFQVIDHLEEHYNTKFFCWVWKQ